MLDDLFTYRLAETAFLTVTNAANHDRDLAWMRGTPRRSMSSWSTGARSSRCSRCRDPSARALVGRLADGRLPPRMHCCQRTVAGAAGAGVRNRLHR